MTPATMTTGPLSIEQQSHAEARPPLARAVVDLQGDVERLRAEHDSLDGPLAGALAAGLKVNLSARRQAPDREIKNAVERLRLAQETLEVHDATARELTSRVQEEHRRHVAAETARHLSEMRAHAQAFRAGFRSLQALGIPTQSGASVIAAHVDGLLQRFEDEAAKFGVTR